MRRRWLTRAGIAALAAAAALGAAACGGDDDESADTSGGGEEDITAVIEALGGPVSFGDPVPGGTYRIENTDFANSDGFDPSGEYFGSAWDIYNNLMLRNLVSYPFTAGEAGNEIIPDMATEIPAVSSDGLSYTFTIKDGITFGPPVNREVTSQDIAYSFERIATPAIAAQYAFWFTPVIKGMQEFADGEADTISGITTPDDKTITFTLNEPTGDFLFRLAMPATAPIPEEVAKCHTQAAEYGRYVISTGPYMIDGADNLDISSCASQKPISGFNPNTGLNLVRNPSYDAATDDPEVRQSFPDRFEIGVNTNLDNIFDRIERGELEGSFETPTNTVLRRYLQDPDNRERLRVNSGDRIWFGYMNLTTPPFDDVHVRKAMNLVMDLEGIQRAWGGPVQGRISQSTVPLTMLPEVGADFQPFQQAPFAGDVEAAKAEMAQSKYDTDQDGTCDAPACKGVINLNRNFAPWTTISPIVAQSAAQIGITIETREASRTAVNDGVQHHRAEDPVQHRQRLGQGLRRPLGVLHHLRRAQHHPERQHRVRAGGRHEGAGGRARGDGPGRRRPEHRRRHRRVPAAPGPGARRLLGGPRQEARRGDRSADHAAGRQRARPARAGRDQLGLRPERQRDGAGPRRGRPVPAELRGGATR